MIGFWASYSPFLNCLYPSIHLSICLPSLCLFFFPSFNHPSIHLFSCLSVHQSVHLSLHVPIHPSVYPLVPLSIHLSVLSVCPSSQSACPAICPFNNTILNSQSVHPSVCPSVIHYLSIHPSVQLSVCPPTHFIDLITIHPSFHPSVIFVSHLSIIFLFIPPSL